jgi:tetratricopeptide (TPR) repeat protein
MMTLREFAGDAPMALGTPVSASAHSLEAGLQIAEGLGDRAFAADVLGRLAVIASNRLRFRAAVTYGRRAVREARDSADAHALAAALDGLKTAYAYMGEIELLSPVLAELEPLLRAQGDLWRLPWMVQESAFPALAAGRWDEALVRLSEALELNRRSGYIAYEGWFLGYIGWLNRLRGDLDEALVQGRRAVELTSNSEHAWWRSAAYAQLAGTLLATGETGAAIDLLDLGRGYAHRSGAESYLLNCLGPLADATGDRAILDEAATMLDSIDVPDGAAWMLGVDAYLSIGRAWLAHDEPAKASAAVAPLLHAATRTGWHWVRDAAAEIALKADPLGTPPAGPPTPTP